MGLVENEALGLSKTSRDWMIESEQEYGVKHMSLAVYFPIPENT
jgi:hypothetical protein